MKLIDLSKAFPNEAFRGLRHVICALLFVYKLMKSVQNERMIETNAVVPLLGFLEQVQLNDELFSVRCVFVGLYQKWGRFE